VINAVKYAFPTVKDDASITVAFDSQADGWTLTVSDNGVGKAETGVAAAHGGLGTVIVDALVKQLDGQMSVTTTAGVTVMIRHKDVVARAPVAA
jgi:chemotaxis protein methyltransferase CheR